MRHKAGIRPSKQMSAVAAVVCGVLFLGGLVMAALFAASGVWLAVLPFLFFLLVTGFNTRYHLLNALGDKAPPMGIIDYDALDNSPVGPSQPNTVKQLRELQVLRDENLISQAEFESKRKAILAKFG